LFTLCFAPAGCSGNKALDAEQLVGVWQIQDFDQVLEGEVLPAVEMYFTADSNAFLFFTNWTSAGHVTDIFHFLYEIADGNMQLTLTQAPSHIEDEGWPEFKVSSVDGKVTITVAVTETATTTMHAGGARQYMLEKVATEVPYGWTDAQKEEIEQTNQSIDQEVHAFAQIFGEAIGLSIVPEERAINFYESYIEHGSEFLIDNRIPVMIAFIGSTPTPAGPERFSGQFIDGGQYVECPSVQNDRFALYYTNHSPPTTTMLTKFESLFD